METWNLIWTKLSRLSSEEVNNIPDNTPGVYRLSYKHEDGNYYVFYVGQSEDIKKRLFEHMSPHEENVCIKNYLLKECVFRYAKISQGDVRSAIEKQAFKYYQPSCNAKEPIGRDDIKGNLN